MRTDLDEVGDGRLRFALGDIGVSGAGLEVDLFRTDETDELARCVDKEPSDFLRDAEGD